MTVSEKIRSHMYAVGWKAEDLALHIGVRKEQLKSMLDQNGYDIIAFKKIAEWMEVPILCEDDSPKLRYRYEIRK